MFTLWLTTYLVPWLVTFTLMGVIIQVLDRYIGVGTYRWYYNRGNKPEDGLPPEKDVGWFYNQPLRRQHNRAIFVSAVQSVLTVFYSRSSFGELVGEVFALVLEGWFLLPGLWLGNKVYALMQRQEQIFDALDHRQEFAVGIMGRARKALGGFLSALRPSGSSERPSQSQPQTPPPKPPETATDEGPRQALDRFLKGRQT